MLQLSDLDRDGFVVIQGILSQESIAQLLGDVEGLLIHAPAGVRELASKVPSVKDLARSSVIREFVEPVLGSQARLVRSVLFSKKSWREEYGS